MILSTDVLGVDFLLPAVPGDLERIAEVDESNVLYPAPELPLEHFFAKGLYARKMTIPAGVRITSRVHKDEHIIVVLRGAILVYSSGIGGVLRRAGDIIVSPPGGRRAGVTLAETEWITFHAVSAREIDSVEEEIFEPLTDRQRELIEKKRPVLSLRELRDQRNYCEA